jgi:hypothetical protein
MRIASERVLEIVEVAEDRIYYKMKGVRSLVPLWMTMEEFKRMQEQGQEQRRQEHKATP